MESCYEETSAIEHLLQHIPSTIKNMPKSVLMAEVETNVILSEYRK